ncbi:50S ribosomal protein L15 [Candidatus Babeliales bacterium]|nr:50S ribosomal protein L15 [Candidatus Babeliales bacterium]
MLKLDKLFLISKKRKRIGRGSDRGGTCCRGHKGQKARSGSESRIKPSFEGGQMSFTRRIPKRGFTNNRFKKEIQIINLSKLEKYFSSGNKVDRESLFKKGLIKGKRKFFIKILGEGKLTKELIICADAFSKSAVEAIKKSGGKIEVVEKEH